MGVDWDEKLAYEYWRHSQASLSIGDCFRFCDGRMGPGTVGYNAYWNAGFCTCG